LEVVLPALVPGPDGHDVLPPGRWTCTRAEFESVFVRPDIGVRRKLIEDLDVYAEQQLKNGLVVTSYWLAGSFVSSKTFPGDIDVTAVIDGSASTPSAGAHDWMTPKDRWKHHIHPDVGRLLLVDGYSITKVPDTHHGLDDYHRLRGYWDDWWQRCRVTGAKLARGYAEVVDWL
jgi:hypothetical protein